MAAKSDVAGAICVFCFERIADADAAHYCEGCRHPMHYDCERPPEKPGRGDCAVCGVNLALAAKVHEKHKRNVAAGGQGGRAAFADYVDYSQVPWYRQSAVNNTFIALGLVCGCFPLTVWTCINLLTGDVYYDKRGPDGTLMKWGPVNKIWATLFAVAWILLLSFVVVIRLIRS